MDAIHICSGPSRAAGPALGRRQALLGAGAGALALGTASLARAATADKRLVVINLKGGLDGLAAVIPYGDSQLTKLRGSLLPPPVGQAGGMLDLGGSYALPPEMTTLHALYKAGDALAVHAVGNVALTRSHFEGQDYLQSGAGQLLASGWLNRALACLPAGSGFETGLAIGASAPLVIRGPTMTAGWTTSPFPKAPASLTPLVTAVTQADPLIGPAMQTGLRDRGVLNAALNWNGGPASPFPCLAWAVGEFLAAPTGPRVAALEVAGFDTHIDQSHRLHAQLATLDAAFAALRATLAAAWKQTVIVTVTEFGRTAAVNGSDGTDHGTAFAMYLAGGAVNGGRVVAQWPGLTASRLYQGRDLAPTVDVRSVLMGVLVDHLGIPASAMSAIFPGASGISPMGQLIRS